MDQAGLSAASEVWSESLCYIDAEGKECVLEGKPLLKPQVKLLG